jgi:hypothetical protein
MSEELAQLHFETAVQMAGAEKIGLWLASLSPATPVAAATQRGRRPGAAPENVRCAWSLADGSHCKNKKSDGHSYCKIHMGKIHLIDSGSASGSK